MRTGQISKGYMQCFHQMDVINSTISKLRKNLRSSPSNSQAPFFDYMQNSSHRSQFTHSRH